jgi:hypothetical protein
MVRRESNCIRGEFSMTKAATFFALLSLVACGPGDREEGEGGGDGTGSGSGSGSGSSTETPRQCEKMDIVFVVDNSGSMEEEQSNLGTNFPMFAQLLQTYTVADGTPLDFRIAVTTTARDIDYTIDLGGGFGTFPQSEMGENGAFQNNCNYNKRWLDNTDADLGNKLACRANVGTSGSGIEMPLLMTKWSLGERVADNTNAGFLRDDALLAIVVLTDEDDASTTEDGFPMDLTGATPTNWQPADQVMFLDTLKGNRTRWAAGVIAGEGNCSSGFGDAADGKRLKDFVAGANSNGYNQAVFHSICDGDLTSGLKDALDKFQQACGSIIL